MEVEFLLGLHCGTLEEYSKNLYDPFRKVESHTMS